MSCNCCCGNNKSNNQINNYNNCTLDESNYIDNHLFLIWGLDGIVGIITYFLAFPEYLQSILEFYNKMEQAKIRGLVQVKINWGSTSDGEIICGDLDCFWKMYNQKGYFYKTILLAVKYQEWFIIIQRQKRMGIHNCCLFDVPLTPDHPINPIQICGCNAEDTNEISIPDERFQFILQNYTDSNIPSGNFNNNTVSKDDLDPITNIAILDILGMYTLFNLVGIECMDNLDYLQIKDSPNNLTVINLCNNSNLINLILNSNSNLKLLILPQNNLIDELDLKNNLQNYGSINPIVLDNVISIPCDINTTNGPYISYANTIYSPGEFSIQ